MKIHRSRSSNLFLFLSMQIEQLKFQSQWLILIEDVIDVF